MNEIMMKYLKGVALIAAVSLFALGCGGDEECQILELTANPIECVTDSTYVLEIDFEVENAGNDFFDLFVRNDELVDFFRLDALPLRIEDFELSGRDYEFIRVCVNDNPDCCREIEFLPPDCKVAGADCELGELIVGVGECTSDSTYVLELDFEVENAGNDFFDLFVRNGELVDFFRLDALPLRIEDFELSGRDYEFIRVCVNDNPNCCREMEFLPPDC